MSPVFWKNALQLNFEAFLLSWLLFEIKSPEFEAKIANYNTKIRLSIRSDCQALCLVSQLKCRGGENFQFGFRPQESTWFLDQTEAQSQPEMKERQNIDASI